MRHSKAMRRWSVVLAAGLLIAACSDDDKAATTTAAPSTTASSSETTQAAPPSSEAPESSAPDSTPEGVDPGVTQCTATVPGSVINYAGYAPTASLDPLQSSGSLVGGTELISIYDVLMRWDKATNDWVPNAAESLTPNDDFTEWTLKIRPEVKYSDGTPMKAQDVIDNMARLMGPGRNGTRGIIIRVNLDESTAIDDQTAVFKLYKPWSTFAYLLGDAAGMVPNPTLAATKNAEGGSIIENDPTGAGAGAYEVARWAPGESPYLVLKARQDYWGGTPCVETINFLSIPADSAKADALETGELDIAFLRTSSVIDDNRDKGYGEMFELQSAGFGVLINDGVGTYTPIVTDPKFREALTYAYDPTIIRERGFDGVMLEERTFIHPDSAFYDSSVAGPPAPDMDKAKELVDELKAGGWDGKVRVDCSNAVPDQGIILKTLMESAGMEVDLTIDSVNAVIKTYVVDKDFDVVCTGMNVSDSAIYRQIGMQFYSTSDSNRTGFDDPAMDDAIDELFAAPDAAARRTATGKIQSIVDTKRPFITYGAVEEGIMYSPKVSDVVLTQQTQFLLANAKVTK